MLKNTVIIIIYLLRTGGIKYLILLMTENLLFKA